MSNTDLKEFYGRYIAAINARDLDQVAEMLHDAVTVNGAPAKREDVLAALAGIPDAVPDFHWEVQDLYVEDDRIAARLQDSGTPTKTFLGMEPTGAAIDIIEYGSYRIRDGRFAEMWFLMDATTAGQQLQSLK